MNLDDYIQVESEAEFPWANDLTAALRETAKKYVGEPADTRTTSALVADLRVVLEDYEQALRNRYKLSMDTAGLLAGDLVVRVVPNPTP